LSNPALVRDLFVGIVSNPAIMGAEWRLAAESASGSTSACGLTSASISGPGFSSGSERVGGAGESDAAEQGDVKDSVRPLKGGMRPPDDPAPPQDVPLPDAPEQYSADYSFLAGLDWSRLTALPSDYIGRNLEQRRAIVSGIC